MEKLTHPQRPGQKGPADAEDGDEAIGPKAKEHSLVATREVE
jgi:hypothetical protein